MFYHRYFTVMEPHVHAFAHLVNGKRERGKMGGRKEMNLHLVSRYLILQICSLNLKSPTYALSKSDCLLFYFKCKDINVIEALIHIREGLPYFF